MVQNTRLETDGTGYETIKRTRNVFWVTCCDFALLHQLKICATSACLSKPGKLKSSAGGTTFVTGERVVDATAVKVLRLARLSPVLHLKVGKWRR